jgi:hypothetical protein
MELKVIENVTADTLHRTAKYFMDSGRAESHGEAMQLLGEFGIHIEVGEEARTSRNHQIAVLTLINVARRTFLGGVEIHGVRRGPLLVPLADTKCFGEAVEELGGRIVERPRPEWPSALIGTASESCCAKPSWQVTWDGWRGGVVPAKGDIRRLQERSLCSLAPAVAAAACASEAFLLFAADHTMAGKRAAGVSLWNPGRDWRIADETEPSLSFLPSRLWMIGLGNLGQSCLWLLTCLPYGVRAEVEFVLQDFDRLAPSNESTSLLTQTSLIGQMKTRAMAEWLERRDFRTAIEERRFGEWIHRSEFEPGVAICGVDNADARKSLESAGFGLVLESGLGSGTQACKNYSVHTFPSAFKAAELWSGDPSRDGADAAAMPAYQRVKHPQLDECGLAQLASRSVGIPFVSITAAAFVLAEILRRLNGGRALELVSGSMSCLDDIEVSRCESGLYEWGHVPVVPC